MEIRHGVKGPLLDCLQQYLCYLFMDQKITVTMQHLIILLCPMTVTVIFVTSLPVIGKFDPHWQLSLALKQSQLAHDGAAFCYSQPVVAYSHCHRYSVSIVTCWRWQRHCWLNSGDNLSLEVVVTLAEPGEVVLDNQQDGPCHSNGASIQQAGDGEFVVIAGREGEQLFLMESP